MFDLIKIFRSTIWSSLNAYQIAYRSNQLGKRYSNHKMRFQFPRAIHLVVIKWDWRNCRSNLSRSFRQEDVMALGYWAVDWTNYVSLYLFSCTWVRVPMIKRFGVPQVKVATGHYLIGSTFSRRQITSAILLVPI